MYMLTVVLDLRIKKKMDVLHGKKAGTDAPADLGVAEVFT